MPTTTGQSSLTANMTYVGPLVSITMINRGHRYSVHPNFVQMLACCSMVLVCPCITHADHLQGRASFRKIDISTPQSIFRNCPFATSVILTRSLIPHSNTRCRSSKGFEEPLLLLPRLLLSISLTNGSNIHLSTGPDRASSRIGSIRQGSDELDSCDWLCGHSGSIQGGPDWHL